MGGIMRERTNLFLDDANIAEMTGLTRSWHHFTKHPANPLVTPSGIESIFFLFGSVIREPDPVRGGEPVFRMWYYGRGNDEGIAGNWTGYAESRYGILWHKPDLGLHTSGGTTHNNIAFRSENFRQIGLAGVMRDPSPDCPDSEAYKLAFAADRGKPSHPDKCYLVASSPDGINWTHRNTFRPVEPVYPDRACLVWDPYEGCYALYGRSVERPDELIERGCPTWFGRTISRITSGDLREWSDPVQVIQADMDDGGSTEIYGASFFPYAGQWIALPQIHRSHPDMAWIDVSVAHSRDGVNWIRERELVLPNGGIGEWDRFNQCASITPVIVGDEIWVYYSGRTYRHGEHKQASFSDSGPMHSAIGLATLRLDGWCSLGASFQGGSVTTRKIDVPTDAHDLVINAKTDWGEVIVDVIGEDGDVIMTSVPITGDSVRLVTAWPERRGLSAVSGQTVRLRFTMRNALLYSWTIA